MDTAAEGTCSVPPDPPPHHSHTDLEVLLLSEDRLRQLLLEAFVRTHHLRGQRDKARSEAARKAAPSRGQPRGPGLAGRHRAGGPRPHQQRLGRGQPRGCVCDSRRAGPARRLPPRRSTGGYRRQGQAPGVRRGGGDSVRRSTAEPTRRTAELSAGSLSKGRSTDIPAQTTPPARRDSNRRHCAASRRCSTSGGGAGGAGRGCPRACALGPPAGGAAELQ